MLSSIEPAAGQFSLEEGAGLFPKGNLPAAPETLQYLRASGLSQVRLQLAVLAGNRRRALIEIDRLVEIDRQLSRIAESEAPDGRQVSSESLKGHLASQRKAIASEKLALTATIELPRVAATHRDEELLVEKTSEFLAVEDTGSGKVIVRAAMWILAAILLVGALAIAVPMLATL